MSQKILIVGAGFAGVWGALGAARVLDGAGVRNSDVEITLISPKPELQIRPRLYESEPQQMAAPLRPLLDAVGVNFLEGSVEQISVHDKTVSVVSANGSTRSFAYDRLLLTSGSRLNRPPVPGLTEYAFSVDRIEDAVALDNHFAELTKLPDSPARNTVAVVGCGFTGIEVATELPKRMRGLFGADAAVRVVVIGSQGDIGPDLGPNPRPYVSEAFESLGVEAMLGSGVVSVDADGVRTASGTHIEAMTVIWAGGMRASSLAAQVSSRIDPLGRVEVTPDLRVAEAPDVFVAGDVARARCDDEHYALMSCQHAIVMGQFGGHNVAADLIGVPTLEYRQPFYATCLDLGEWGAVYSEAWDRQIKLTHAEGKTRKQMINTQWIYPPAPNRTEALAAGNPQASLG
ncbi:NAD(P)/FAD-dependent oxidoreductase [Paraburkholderia sp. MM5384-R2]|uniref:NAD(P)/FAD-dependent oxidoreductase n=1 Tax=Paraburkholderia sp. MM5384-R2 TaxID=2723097 RepID=UPI0016129776|nr:NAD(P)/FAD-dependent oxidoreductase [Paraburkholderia sp. MM5384-R2]MBB5502225.1 NADH dehydrogenase [Paraburkholderia sp. MM5384-R2]